MGNLSSYEGNRLGNAMLRNQAYTPATTVYVALSAGGVAEISGGGYARQAISMAAFADKSSSNSAQINFPIATADWGTITHAALYDAATAGNGLTGWTALTTSQTVYAWDQLQIPAGSLTWSF